MSNYFVDTNVILNYCHEFENCNEKSRKLIDEKKVHCSEVSRDEIEEVKEYNAWIYRTLLRGIKQASVTDRKLFDGGQLYRLLCADSRFRPSKYGHIQGLLEHALQKAKKKGGTPDRNKLVTALNLIKNEISAYSKQAFSRIVVVPLVADAELEKKLSKIVLETEDRKIVSEAGCWFNTNTNLDGKSFVSHDIEHIIKQKELIVPLIDAHFTGNVKFNMCSLFELTV